MFILKPLIYPSPHGLHRLPELNPLPCLQSSFALQGPVFNPWAKLSYLYPTRVCVFVCVCLRWKERLSGSACPFILLMLLLSECYFGDNWCVPFWCKNIPCPGSHDKCNHKKFKMLLFKIYFLIKLFCEMIIIWITYSIVIIHYALAWGQVWESWSLARLLSEQKLCNRTEKETQIYRTVI